MPVHDWTQVDAGTFHHLHTLWIAELSNALNGGLLPKGYYAMAEQHAGMSVADILTLQMDQNDPAAPRESGGVALASPPRLSRKMVASPIDSYRLARRTLAIRHISKHRVVALLEIVSPANKDRPSSVSDFVDKALAAIHHSVHLLVIDLFPPGPSDPRGIHAAIWEHFNAQVEGLPADKPLAVSAYAASKLPEAWIEPLAVGDPLPDGPLFLEPRWHIDVPLEATYQAAYRGVPGYWREVIEAKQAPH
jgi:hypothetical protein